MNLRRGWCAALVSGLLVGLGASEATAQVQQWHDRGFVGINFGFQPGSQDLLNSASFPLYDELATIETFQEVDGGGLFDIGGGIRVRGDLGVGVSFTRLSGDTEARIDAQVPHPVFFDRFRNASLLVDDVGHSEIGIHLQAIWFVAASDKIDLAFSAGPSFFRVSQELVRDITVVEAAGFPFTSVALSSPLVEEQDESAVGINVGIDGTYLVTPRVGVGLFLRYAGSSVDLEIAEGETERDVGGFQAGVGARFKF